MKKFIQRALIALTVYVLFLVGIPIIIQGATILFPVGGGTGTSTPPVANSILIGNSGGTYDVKTLTQGNNVTISNSGSAVTISSSASGGTGNVATSTGETAGQLSYWTSTNATPATLGKVATTTLTASAPLSLSNPISVIGASASALSCTNASGGVTGCLTGTDWNTFNGKQTAGNYITALTGDVTASGPGSVAATLATVNTNTGSFGGSTAIPNFTVNGKGLITAAGTNVVIAPAGTLSGTTLNSTVVTSSLTAVGTIGTGVWNAGAITSSGLLTINGTGTSTLFSSLKISTTSQDALNVQDQYGTSVLNVFTASTTGNIFEIASSTNQTLVAVTQGGYLGIGSSTPSVALVASSSEVSTGTSVLYLDTASKNFAAGGPIMDFAQGGQTTAAFYSSTGSGNANPFLAFMVSPNTTNPVEAARFDKNGNLGIGTTTPNSKLDVYGAITTNEVQTATNYDISTATTSFAIIGVTSTASTRTITLPLCDGTDAGLLLTVKDESGAAGTNNITVSRKGSDTIDGATTKVINGNFNSVDFYCSLTASKWFIK